MILYCFSWQIAKSPDMKRRAEKQSWEIYCRISNTWGVLYSEKPNRNQEW